MSTVMFYPETLPAEKRSVEDSRKAVDLLMEYDRKLSEGFSKRELRKLFLADDHDRPVLHGNVRESYLALTESEKRILDTLGFAPPEATHDSSDTKPDVINITDQRRRMKAALIEPPDIPAVVDFMPPLAQEPEDASAKRVPRALRTEWRSTWERNGKIYVWLDSMRFRDYLGLDGDSDKKGFYYVRCHNSMNCVGPFGVGVTSGYGDPVLIVQKNKLRSDQVEYMERKCRETRETEDPVIGFMTAQKKSAYPQ